MDNTNEILLFVLSFLSAWSIFFAGFSKILSDTVFDVYIFMSTFSRGITLGESNCKKFFSNHLH